MCENYRHVLYAAVLLFNNILFLHILFVYYMTRNMLKPLGIGGLCVQIVTANFNAVVVIPKYRRNTR